MVFKVLKTLFVVLLLIIVLLAGYKIVDLEKKLEIVEVSEAKYSTEDIEKQISEISELATLEYKYRNAAKSEEDPYKLFGAIDVPFTNKKMIVSYEGVIKLGTDLTQSKISLNEEDGITTIEIVLKPCEILNNEINEDSWEFWDMTSSIFNRLTPEDDSNLRKEQKNVMSQYVEESGLLEEADKKAKTQIETLMKILYPDAIIKVEFDKL